MNEEELIEKRLLIFLFVGFLILLATVSVVCIMYSPKTLTPSFSYAEPESEPESENIHYDASSKDESGIFPIEINRASEEELQLIPDIGPSTAKLIIDYRNEYGSIVSFNELLSIDGIGEKTVLVLKEYCIIN
ncbi:MAG: helix-hairpin-helix domain-containing protein [Oscillospiraceae bacterium]|nr:helix-hairpin-helix domain-containing protein [Oscillospiraceae bacterium]